MQTPQRAQAAPFHTALRLVLTPGLTWRDVQAGPKPTTIVMGSVISLFLLAASGVWLAYSWYPQDSYALSYPDRKAAVEPKMVRVSNLLTGLLWLVSGLGFGKATWECVYRCGKVAKRTAGMAGLRRADVCVQVKRLSSLGAEVEGVGAQM